MNASIFAENNTSIGHGRNLPFPVFGQKFSGILNELKNNRYRIFNGIVSKYTKIDFKGMENLRSLIDLFSNYLPLLSFQFVLIKPVSTK